MTLHDSPGSRSPWFRVSPCAPPLSSARRKTAATSLSWGGWTLFQKGLDLMLSAYQIYRDRYGGEARLVLIGPPVNDFANQAGASSARNSV